MTRFSSRREPRSSINLSQSLYAEEEEVDLLAPLRSDYSMRTTVWMYVPLTGRPLRAVSGGWGMAFFLSKFEMGRWNIGMSGAE